MRKKRKLLYHRLAILVISAGLILAFLIAGTLQLYDFIRNDSKELTAVEKKAVPNPNTIKEEKEIVVIDPGHGGYDGGSLGRDGSLEKDLTLSIALKVGNILKKEDVSVIYTREDDNVYWTNDNKEDLMNRVNVSTKNDASLFLSIHLNFSEDGDDIRGHEIWSSHTSQNNINFASNISSSLSELNYSEDRGVKDERDENLLVLHYNPVTSALVELGFMSNWEDLNYLKSKAGQKKVAQSLAKGIMLTLGSNGK